MADDENPERPEATVDETVGAGEPSPAASARQAPRPSPGATAASRARRIGGATRAGAPAARPAATGPAAGADDAGAGPADSGGDGPGSLDTATDTDTDTDGEAGTDTAVDDDAAGVDADGARPDVPVWLTWAPAAILVAGALAMAVIVGIVSHGVWWGKDTASQTSVNQLRQQVSAAAKTCLAATNTYKYTDIDAFEKAGTACTTGTQTTQFRKAVDTLIRKNAPKLKFSQTAQINKAAIESVNGNQWTILLYGQLAVTNVNTPNGRTDPFAAVVRMEKVHGKWLISSLRTVSSPVN